MDCCANGFRREHGLRWPKRGARAGAGERGKQRVLSWLRYKDGTGDRGGVVGRVSCRVCLLELSLPFFIVGVGAASGASVRCGRAWQKNICAAHTHAYKQTNTHTDTHTHRRGTHTHTASGLWPRQL